MTAKKILTISADFDSQQVEVEPEPGLLREEPTTQAEAVRATIAALDRALEAMAPEQTQFEEDFEKAETRVNNHGTRQNLDALEGSQIKKLRVMPDGALLLSCEDGRRFLLSGGPEPIRAVDISGTPTAEFEGMCAFLERENGTHYLDFPTEQDLVVFKEGLDRGLHEEDTISPEQARPKKSKLN